MKNNVKSQPISDLMNNIYRRA